jgi:anti-sigma factor RsiW
MTDNWKDILIQSSAIDQKKLMDYLEGKLSDKEKHEVESLLNDSPFLDDAVEGLSQMKDKQKIAAILTELDNHLHQKIKEKKKRKAKDLFFPGWLVFATATIIILILIAFIIYKMYTTK